MPWHFILSQPQLLDAVCQGLGYKDALWKVLDQIELAMLWSQLTSFPPLRPEGSL